MGHDGTELSANNGILVIGDDGTEQSYSRYREDSYEQLYLTFNRRMHIAGVYYKRVLITALEQHVTHDIPLNQLAEKHKVRITDLKDLKTLYKP